MAAVLELHRSVADPSDGAELSAALLEVAQTIASESDIRTILERLSAITLRILGAERCAILLESEEGSSRFYPVAASSKSSNLAAYRRFLGATPLDVTSHPELQRIWNSDGPAAIEDPQVLLSLPADWTNLGSKSAAVAPIRAAQKKFGVLVLDYVSRTHSFSRSELDFIDSIARSAGTALAQSELFGRLTRSMEFQRRLLKCTSALLSGGPLRNVLEHVMDGLHELVGITHCLAYLIESDDDRLTLLGGRGWNEPRRHSRLADFDAGAVAWIRKTWQESPTRIVRLPNMQAYSGWGNVPEHLGPGMLIPLADGDRIIGFLLAARAGVQQFTHDDLKLVGAFSSQVTLAVREARMRDELDGRAKAMEAVRRLSDVIARSTDLKAAIGVLNRDVCADIGLEISEITFISPLLCSILGIATPRRADKETILQLRGKPDSKILMTPSGPVVPIRMRQRVMGLMRLSSDLSAEPAIQQFVVHLADGIAEVATKARVRHLSEQRASELAVAAERERMARDLHDTVGQILYAVSLEAQTCLTVDPRNDTDLDTLSERLREVVRLSAEGVREVRSAIYALAFLHVKNEGLLQSLKSLTRDFSRTSGITCRLNLKLGGRTRFPADIESVVYRVAHEALTNVDRHSRASGVVVSLEAEGQMLALSVRDDGVGVDQRQAADFRSSTHLGLKMMAKSVESLGGKFETAAASPRGFIIKARIPM